MEGKKKLILNYSIFKRVIIYFLYADVKIKHKILFNLAVFINVFFLNNYIYVYNGLNLKKLKFSIFMLNYHLGEFIFTRRFYKFFKNKNLQVLLKKR